MGRAATRHHREQHRRKNSCISQRRMQLQYVNVAVFWSIQSKEAVGVMAAAAAAEC